MAGFQPLGARVLIERAEPEEKTSGGLFIPDNAKEKMSRGRVVAVGPGTMDEPMQVKAGDMVLFGRYAGTDVSIEGKTYLVVAQDEVLGVFS